MEYAIYPFEYMRIKQRHDEGNHLAHWNPFIDYADKPVDEACEDTGRQYFVPQNDYVVDEIILSSYSVRLTTLNKVKTPYKDEPDYLHITLTHIEQNDLKKLKVGQIIHKNEKLIIEGKGGADAYHFHCTYNFGKYYGIKENANKKYCFVYDKSLLPNEAYYLDPNFNKIKDSRDYVFNNIPIENKENDYVKSSIKVYQEHNDLKATGIIDDTTLKKMKEDGLYE